MTTSAYQPVGALAHCKRRMRLAVLGVSPARVNVGVLFAAMPVGANAFMFAAKYDRAVGSVSAAISVSTALAVRSVTGVLYLLTLVP